LCWAFQPPKSFRKRFDPISLSLTPPPPHHPNPPHHNHHPQAPKQEDFAEPPYRGVIHMIIGGSSVDFDTKRQKRDHY
jgi:hypothetical protein